MEELETIILGREGSCRRYTSNILTMLLLQELERRVELVGRNRAQEVKSLLQRNKSLAHEMEELKEYTQKMHMQLRVR